MKKILYSILLMLSGCAWFSPVSSHHAQLKLNSWTTDTDQLTKYSESTNLSDSPWWNEFKDPQLNQLIQQALTHNPNIDMAVGNIIQAEAMLEKTKMAWVPTINLGASFINGQSFNQNFSNNSTNSLLAGLSPSSSNKFISYSGGFVASYNLNVLGLLKNQEIAQLNLTINQIARNATRLAIISQISGAYFTLLGLEEKLKLQKQMVHDAQKLKTLTELEKNNGNVSELNLAFIAQLIANLKAQLPLIENSIIQSKNAILLLSNHDPIKLTTNNQFNQIKTNNLVLINLPSKVLQQRPDVLIADYQLQLVDAKIGAARAQFFPTINLTNPLGVGSLQLKNLFSTGADFWSTQISAAIPILNLGNFSDIKNAKGAYYTAYYSYINTLRTAFMEVDNGLSSHWSDNQNYLAQTEALKSAISAYKFSQKEYQLGAKSYLDTLNTKLNFDYAQLQVNSAKIEQLKSMVNLYQVLAGGYNVNNVELRKKFADGHDIN